MLAGGERAFTVLEAALSGTVDDASREEAARAAGAPIETYRFVLALGVHAVPHVLLGTREIRDAASEADYARAFEEATAKNGR